jgi:cytochrome b561
MMLRDIAYAPIAGLPLVIWPGLAAMALFIAAATIMALNKFTKVRVPVKWHPRFAAAALIIALIHMILALSGYLQY